MLAFSVLSVAYILSRSANPSRRSSILCQNRTHGSREIHKYDPLLTTVNGRPSVRWPRLGYLVNHVSRRTGWQLSSEIVEIVKCCRSRIVLLPFRRRFFLLLWLWNGNERHGKLSAGDISSHSLSGVLLGLRLSCNICDNACHYLSMCKILSRTSCQIHT